jgi:hypothetical protein
LELAVDCAGRVAVWAAAAKLPPVPIAHRSTAFVDSS